jgi:hypothetical protein
MCLFHARLSTTSFRSGHQTMTVTTTRHETEPVTVKLTSETHSVNRGLHCLDEMRCICFYARLLSLY